MNRLLIGICCVFAAWSLKARAEEARSWDFAGTQVSIEGTRDGETLTVRRKGADPVEIKDFRISLTNPGGANVTGGTAPQLVISTWTGGSPHCCFTTHLVELGDKPHLIQTFDVGHGSPTELFVQLDDDPALEIALPDWSFANWPNGFAASPTPHIILNWDGAQYVPSVKLMRAGTMLYQMQERRQPQSDEETVGAVFQDALDMIYAGRMKAARTLLKQLLPATPDNKRLELEFFDCKLPSSPWWPFVASLNNLTPKPVASSCPTPQKG